jgi:uncharacterized membrane protein YkvA (DUF1232 family)
MLEQTMPFERTAHWGQSFSGDRVRRDEERVRRGFWRKAGRVAARLPFAEDLLAAYFCAFDPATPFPVKAALFGALAYFVLPFDFVPDLLPFFGFADDAAVLLTTLRLVAGNLRPEHRDAARTALERLKRQA